MMSLRLRRFEAVQPFYEHVEPYLLTHEAENNMILGLCAAIEAGIYVEHNYLACVEQNDEVVGVALRTSPHPVHLSRMEAEIVPLFVEDLKHVYDRLPSVNGSPTAAHSFAELWSQHSGQSYRLKINMGLYQLTQVQPAQLVVGEYRPAVISDLDQVVDWLIAFEQEALGGQPDREHMITAAKSRIPSQATRGFRLWCVDGHPISMAGYAGPTPHGIRVNAVYTPPEQRGHGYASACVAALSQEMLDSGRQFCFLYTDLTNPTSNKIYMQIGYQPVGNVQNYEFT